MTKINIEEGKEILCIRFVNVGGYDCIEEHQNMINSIGYVWFGKIGSKPATKILEKMINNKSNYILLKDPKNAYICKFDAFSLSMPKDNEFPNYYKSEFINRKNFSIWFKLIVIKRVEDLRKLNVVVVKSSLSPILETTNRSMASFFYTVTRQDISL